MPTVTSSLKWKTRAKAFRCRSAPKLFLRQAVLPAWASGECESACAARRNAGDSFERRRQRHAHNRASSRLRTAHLGGSEIRGGWTLEPGGEETSYRSVQHRTYWKFVTAICATFFARSNVALRLPPINRTLPVTS